MKDKSIIRNSILALIGTALMFAMMIITSFNNYLAGLLGIVGCVSLYFVMVFADPKRDFLNLRSLFTLVWIVTIALAQFRLLEYQRPWLTKTWICVILVYFAMQSGCIVGETIVDKASPKFGRKPKFLQKLRIELSEKRLFAFCVGFGLFGVACFIANIIIRGYVPFFSTKFNAYANYYTKFYLFAVAATMISGPCYYCLKTCKLKLWQKILLWFCIIHSTFLFPILVVSRGAFATSALSLTCAFYYLNKRRFRVLVACLVVMFGVYLLCSYARNYTEDQLQEMFPSSDVVIGDHTDSTFETGPGEADSSDVTPSDGVHFQLSGQVAFLYSYLTVSHDNLNEAVEHTTEFTWGLRQMRPFNVLLRIDAIDEALENLTFYQVRKHLNTVNFAGNAYYDFGIVGMFLLPFIWAIAFGMMQAVYLKTNSPYMLLALGNTVSVVVLSFFSAWMSLFSTWMHWGVALILFLVCGLASNKDTVTENYIEGND